MTGQGDPTEPSLDMSLFSYGVIKSLREKYPMTRQVNLFGATRDINLRLRVNPNIGNMLTKNQTSDNWPWVRKSLLHTDLWPEAKNHAIPFGVPYIFCDINICQKCPFEVLFEPSYPVLGSPTSLWPCQSVGNTCDKFICSTIIYGN